jgi:hypothetical protein
MTYFKILLCKLFIRWRKKCGNVALSTYPIRPMRMMEISYKYDVQDLSLYEVTKSWKMGHENVLGFFVGLWISCTHITTLKLGNMNKSCIIMNITRFVTNYYGGKLYYIIILYIFIYLFIYKSINAHFVLKWVYMVVMCVSLSCHLNAVVHYMDYME